MTSVLQHGFWKADIIHTFSKLHLLHCCSLACRNDRLGKMGSIDQLPVSPQNSPHRLLKKMTVLRHVYHCTGPVPHPLCEFSGKNKVSDFYHIHFLFSSLPLQGLSMAFPALTHSLIPFLLLRAFCQGLAGQPDIGWLRKMIFALILDANTLITLN